ncbi:MAG: tyrosine-type recombinase/integrase [Proteobacteria bacterium]|nr:tyrosine-type recombinase/integrase [Pseudomonadota bacterium]
MLHDIAELIAEAMPDDVGELIDSPALWIAAQRVVSNRHALPVAKLCLATGLRWGESETIKRRQIKGGRVSVTGKNAKVRHLPIEPRLAAELIAHHDEIETGDRLFSSAYGAFEAAIDRCSFELPKGQLSHILRHTFASKFMQNGGSIITLQKALDHDDLKTTMRYAHLAPDHLDQVLQLNPLARFYADQETPKVSTKPQPNSAATT